MYLLKVIIIALMFTSLKSSPSVSGFVRDISNGEPISYANVFISNSTIGSTTNRDGYFALSDLQVGKYELNVTMIGFASYKDSVELLTDESVRLDIVLRSQVLESSEILVTAERQKFQRAIESSQISLDIRELNSAPAFIEPDVFRTLQMLPGVQTTSDFSSALYVRGSTPDQNLIMLDGIAIYNPYHLGGIFSTFNTDAIKEADFRAGGFSARYGGRMGAILNVINREGNTEKIKGSANLSLISSKILIEGPVPKWRGIKGSWMFSGRRTYIDKVANALKIPNGQKREDGSEIYYEFPYYFYDYQMKANIDLNQDHRLTFTRFYGDDVLDFSYEDPLRVARGNNVTVQQEFHIGLDWPWGNKTNGLTWRWIISPKIIAKTFISSSRYRFDFDLSFVDRDTYIYSDSTIINFTNFNWNIYDLIKDRTIETEVQYKLSKNHDLTAGIQLRNIDFDLGINYELTTQDTFFIWNPLSLKNSTQEFAVFAQDRWEVSKNLKIRGGLRITDYNLHDKIYLDPRFGVKYNLSDNIALKTNWGLYHQFLTTASNQDENLRLVELWLGIPENKPASISEHLITGLEYMSKENIFYRIELYNKTFENLLTLKQDNANEFEGVSQDSTINEFWDTRGNSKGIELLIKKSSGRFNGWVGYTFSETKYFTQPNGWYSPNFDRTNTLNIVANFEINSDLEFSAALTQSTGNPYTKILGRVYDWEQNLYSDSYWYPLDSYLVGDKNTERYEDYFRVDVGMTRKGGNIFGLKYDTYWQIMNLTRHLNILTYNYRTKTDLLTGNQLGVQRQPIPMFPLIFTFGVNFEF
tara:strand:- start:683 stop:3118 length:2436 start_codon:yes stop_codon:yes gene_type:complete